MVSADGNCLQIFNLLCGTGNDGLMSFAIINKEE
jgi:hypothetical protein